MPTINNNKPKKGFLKKFIAPVFRGALKSVPFGNVALEIADEFKAKEHNTEKYISVIVQIAGISLIIYAFASGKIDINNALDLLNGIK